MGATEIRKIDAWTRAQLDIITRMPWIQQEAGTVFKTVCSGCYDSDFTLLVVTVPLWIFASCKKERKGTRAGTYESRKLDLLLTSSKPTTDRS